MYGYVYLYDYCSYLLHKRSLVVSPSTSLVPYKTFSMDWRVSIQDLFSLDKVTSPPRQAFARTLYNHI